MSSPTKISFTAGSFQSGQSRASGSRSNSVTSYPDYAPPAYEIATAISVPNIETDEVLRDDQSGARIIDQDTESVVSHNPFHEFPYDSSRFLTPSVPPESALQPFVVQAKRGEKFLDSTLDVIDTSTVENHGVLPHHWVQMLEDVSFVAKLTKGQRFAARILPMMMLMGCTGFFASRTIEKVMNRGNAAGVIGLLDSWNEQFFKPRGLEIIVCRGDWQVSSASACDQVQLSAPHRINTQSQRRGCCANRGQGVYINAEVEEQFDRRSKCERRRMMRAERMAIRGHQGFNCSFRDMYRLVVVSI